MHTNLRALFAVILLLLTGAILHADVVLEAGTTNCDNQGSTPQFCSVSFDTFQTGPPFGSANAQSQALPGALGVAVQAHAKLDPITGPGNFGHNISASASETISDLIFSTTGDATDVLMSMNFFAHIDGVVSPSVALTGSARVAASVSADWGVNFDDGQGGMDSAEDFLQIGVVDLDGTTTPTDSLTGDFTGASGTSSLLNGGVVLTSPLFTVPIGTPVSMNLFVGASAGAGWINCSVDCTAAQADIEFGALNTFGLPTSGPVFNLPEGFTVNSVDGQIVDNHFVGTTMAATPEPAAIPILGGAIIGMFAARKRRKAA